MQYTRTNINVKDLNAILRGKARLALQHQMVVAVEQTPVQVLRGEFTLLLQDAGAVTIEDALIPYVPIEVVPTNTVNPRPDDAYIHPDNVQAVSQYRNVMGVDQSAKGLSYYVLSTNCAGKRRLASWGCTQSWGIIDFHIQQDNVALCVVDSHPNVLETAAWQRRHMSKRVLGSFSSTHPNVGFVHTEWNNTVSIDRVNAEYLAQQHINIFHKYQREDVDLHSIAFALIAEQLLGKA